ncbi:MAG: FkbM family methyltransferase, partial [Minisyncoccota bacterium]
MNYYIMSTPTLNTFSKEEAYEYVKKHGRSIKEIKKIEMWTISQIIKTYSNNIFPDILLIDTEGLDFTILKSIDWSGSLPKIICVETMSHSENKNIDILKFMEEKNYIIYADTYINTIFVRKDVWEKRHI